MHHYWFDYTNILLDLWEEFRKARESVNVFRKPGIFWRILHEDGVLELFEGQPFVKVILEEGLSFSVDYLSFQGNRALNCYIFKEVLNTSSLPLKIRIYDCDRSVFYFHRQRPRDGLNLKPCSNWKTKNTIHFTSKQFSLCYLVFYILLLVHKHVYSLQNC